MLIDDCYFLEQESLSHRNSPAAFYEQLVSIGQDHIRLRPASP
jgi:hypothetical protein